MCCSLTEVEKLIRSAVTKPATSTEPYCLKTVHTKPEYQFYTAWSSLTAGITFSIF